jgi:hypothetical protein
MVNFNEVIPQVLQAPPKTIQVLFKKLRGKYFLLQCICEYAIIENGRVIWITSGKQNSSVFPGLAIRKFQSIAIQVTGVAWFRA